MCINGFTARIQVCKLYLGRKFYSSYNFLCYSDMDKQKAALVEAYIRLGNAQVNVLKKREGGAGACGISVPPSSPKAPLSPRSASPSPTPPPPQGDSETRPPRSRSPSPSPSAIQSEPPVTIEHLDKTVQEVQKYVELTDSKVR